MNARRHVDGYVIRLPVQLSPDVRGRVEEHYVRLCADIDNECIRKVARSLPRLVNKLGSGEGRFRKELARTAKVLFDVFVQHSVAKSAGVRLSDQGRMAVIGALRYLCEPLDIIPDYLGIEGFVDDAYVLNICIKSLRRSDLAVFEAVCVALWEEV